MSYIGGENLPFRHNYETSFLKGKLLPIEEQTLHGQQISDLRVVVNEEGGLYYFLSSVESRHYILFSAETQSFYVEFDDSVHDVIYSHEDDIFFIPNPQGEAIVSEADEIFFEDDGYDLSPITNEAGVPTSLVFTDGQVEWSSGLYFDQEADRYVIEDQYGERMFAEVTYSKSGRKYLPTFEYLHEREEELMDYIPERIVDHNVMLPNLVERIPNQSPQLLATLLMIAGLMTAIVMLVSTLQSQNVDWGDLVANMIPKQPTSTPMPTATALPTATTAPQPENFVYTGEVPGLVTLTQKAVDHLNNTYGYVIPWEVPWSLIMIETKGRCAPSHSVFHQYASSTVATLGDAPTYGPVRLYSDSCTGDPMQTAMAIDGNRLAPQVRGISQFSTDLLTNLLNSSMYTDFKADTGTMFDTCTKAIGVTDRTGTKESDIAPNGTSLLPAYLQSRASRAITGDNVCMAAINAAVIAGRGHGNGSFLTESGWFDGNGNLQPGVLNTVGARYHGACVYTYQTDDGPVTVYYCSQLKGLAEWTNDNFGD